MTAMHLFQRPCPVCGSDRGELLVRMRFAAFEDGTLPPEFDLVGCLGCGLAFHDLDLPARDLAAHYGRARPVTAGATPGGGGASAADREHYRAILGRLATWADPDMDQPVWEVGCGAGGLLAALREAGYQRLLGVELWPEAVAKLTRQGFSVALGSALRLPEIPGLHPPDTPPPPGAPLEADRRPGLIIYSHVLEHLADPRAALRQAAERLAPGGLIYVEVPDAAAYDAQQPFRELYQEHLMHFDATALAFLLRSKGFEILSRGRGRLAGGAVIWAVASFQGSRPSSAGQEEGLGRWDGLLSLRSYLRACARHPVIQRLTDLAGERRTWWLWGLSQQTLFFLGSTDLGRATIRHLIDADPAKQGRRMRPVADPGDWADPAAEPPAPEADAFRVWVRPGAQAGRSVAIDGPATGWTVEPPDALRHAHREDGLILAAWGRGREMRARLKAMGFSGSVVCLDEEE